jgi:ornithine carbamoyltransferase
MDVWLAHPKCWQLPNWVIEQAKENAATYGGL